MAITNAMIVAMEQARLLEEGVLRYTGRTLHGFNILTQQEEDWPEIQPIHTFAKWKSMGYRVKRGEKAIAKFPVWKYQTKKPKDDETDGEVKKQGRGYCFMKESAFFTDEQVEKIEE